MNKSQRIRNHNLYSKHQQKFLKVTTEQYVALKKNTTKLLLRSFSIDHLLLLRIGNVLKLVKVLTCNCTGEK